MRHPQFGIGTVISVEALDDDTKLVVRFSIGQKTLRAKFARLEVASSETVSDSFSLSDSFVALEHEPRTR